ncbi:hypothetical protein ACWCOW_36235 [Streptomyces sp. NPDC001939]
MDTGDVISAASAAVAALAAIVGWWQARSAKGAVKAAEEQVHVMRDQLALERSLRDDGIRPRFEITHTTIMVLSGGDGRLTIEIAQIQGVPLDDVEVELFAGTRQIVPAEAGDSASTRLYSAPGSRITLRAHLDAEIAQARSIRVELIGTQARGSRRWGQRLIAHPDVTESGLLTDLRQRRELEQRLRLDQGQLGGMCLSTAETLPEDWQEDDETRRSRELMMFHILQGDLTEIDLTDVIASLQRLLYPNSLAQLPRPAESPGRPAPEEATCDDLPHNDTGLEG